MDIDAIGKHIPALLAFKERVERLIEGADNHAERASNDLADLQSLKSEIETVLPEIRKAIADASTLSEEVAVIRMQLQPALAWIAEQQAKQVAAPTHEPPAGEQAADQGEARDDHAGAETPAS